MRSDRERPARGAASVPLQFVLARKPATFLIVLCFLFYSTAYIGRYSYAANLLNITGDFGVDKDTAGLVSSFFFFSYAAGQLLNSWLAKLYEPRRVVTLAMAVSALCNLGIGLCPDIVIMRPVWLLNGIAQSMLWCCLLNMQSRYLSRADVARAIIWNSMTVAAGTVSCYGLSALLTALHVDWRIMFYISAALLLGVGLTWWFGIGYIENMAHSGKGMIPNPDPQPAPVPQDQAADEKPVRLFTRAFMPAFVLACVIAAACSFIRDGVVTWLPNILHESFGVDTSNSIAMTMLLPMISVLGAITVRQMQKRLKGNMLMEGLLFLVAAIAIGVIVLLFPAKLTILTVALFAIVYWMLMAISNITTSIIPFACRSRGNVGGVSALLDACCYLGTMISTYTFGAVAENFGWMYVLYLAAGISVVSVIICGIATLLARRDQVTKEIL